MAPLPAAGAGGGEAVEPARWRWPGCASSCWEGGRQRCTHLLPRPSGELRLYLFTGTSPLDLKAWKSLATLPSQLGSFTNLPPPFPGKEVTTLSNHLEYVSLIPGKANTAHLDESALGPRGRVSSEHPTFTLNWPHLL